MSYGLLSLAALMCVLRMLKARTIANRIVALDLLLVIVVLFLAVATAQTGEHSYLNVLVVVALLGFIGTALVAAFIERRGT
ncbi:MAG: sodium:proton antiporter [Acidimicrobiia bacterium]|nr:sodium:proton antiporter [Acidimicrobiia bacterium]